MQDFDADEQVIYAAMGEPAATCPPLPLLRAADEGVLPEDVMQRIEAHLATCRCCRGLIDDFKTLPEVELTHSQRQRIAQKLSTREHVDVRSGFGRWWSGVAIAAMLVVGVITINHLRKDGQRTDAQMVPVKTANAAPDTTVAVLELPLTPLAPPSTAATSLQTRGAAVAEPSTEQLLPAFEAYNEGKYSAAAERFSVLRRGYPHSELVALYLGVSQVLLHQDEAAAETLDTVSVSKNAERRAAAEWYSAVATQRLQPEATKAKLTALCADAGSAYSAQSCKLLGEWRR